MKRRPQNLVIVRKWLYLLVSEIKRIFFINRSARLVFFGNSDQVKGLNLPCAKSPDKLLAKNTIITK